MSGRESTFFEWTGHRRRTSWPWAQARRKVWNPQADRLLHMPSISSRDYGYWRSLEELAGSAEFHRFADGEFPSEWKEPLSRRGLLQAMGASLALASLSGCVREPTEKIVPYVRAPEEIVPGKPLFFATAMTLGGFARGLVVESHMGRPTKVEGNPQHPASLGATDVFAQASVLTLYDPDRSQVVTQRGRISSWVAFVAALNLGTRGATA